MSDVTATVSVRVMCRQEFRFDQIIVFSRDDWQEFKALGEKEQLGLLENRIDPLDIADFDDLDNFWAVVVDENGKHMQPLDEIEVN